MLKQSEPAGSKSSLSGQLHKEISSMKHIGMKGKFSELPASIAALKVSISGTGIVVPRRRSFAIDAFEDNAVCG
jgi:hypothetical protein